MKRMLKRICVFGLVAILSVSSFVGLNFQASAFSNQGKCGDNAYYSVQNDVLTIYGTGATYDYFGGSGSQVESAKEIHNSDIPWQISDYEAYNSGNMSFGNDQIKQVIIQEGITKLGKGIFQGFSKMIDISLPSTLEDIGSGCFDYCSSLEKIELPANLKFLGKEDNHSENGMFESCSSLKEVIIPEDSQLEYIEKGAFYEAGVYEGIKMFIPANCKKIDERAFNGWFSSFEVDPQNQYYTSKDGVLYSKDMTQLIQFPVSSKVQAFQIPDSVTEICAGAFYGFGLGIYDFENHSFPCDYVSLFIPDSVEKMGERAISTEAPLKIYFEGSKEKYDTFDSVGDKNAIRIVSSELTVFNASRSDFSKETGLSLETNEQSNNAAFAIVIVFVLLLFAAIVLAAVLIKKRKE